MKMKHHDIAVSLDGGDVMLEQQVGYDEPQVIILSPDQVLAIADNLRGIVRPSPEAEESRKLRVIADMLSEVVCDQGFVQSMLDGQCHTDWLERINAIDSLLWEFAYGLQPEKRNPATEDTPTKPAGGKVRKAEQGDLLNA